MLCSANVYSFLEPVPKAWLIKGLECSFQGETNECMKDGFMKRDENDEVVALVIEGFDLH